MLLFDQPYVANPFIDGVGNPLIEYLPWTCRKSTDGRCPIIGVDLLFSGFFLFFRPECAFPSRIGDAFCEEGSELGGFGERLGLFGL